MSSKILLRRDSLANWQSANPILGQGEPGLVTDSNPYKLKLGDGQTAWNSLPYFVGNTISIQAVGSPLIFDAATGILTINTLSITDGTNF